MRPARAIPREIWVLDFERWLLNTRQITEFVTPSRFVDESFTPYAAKVLGPTAP